MITARLRSDLVASRLDTPEGRRFVLKDPRSGRYYRLREMEYDIARRLDGATELPRFAATISHELGAEVDVDTLEAFVAKLQRSGLLEDPSAPGPSQPRPRFVRGTPLYLRFRAFDPDRLLDILIGRVQFFFTRGFAIGSAMLLLWAIFTAVVERGAILQDLARIWSFQSLLIAWITVLAVTTLHEFAHGLTCKHFGGHVHEMGFMLIYFNPAFYCNVSDAWLFPKKSSRLLVTAAGAYFELFVWSVATLVWTVVEQGTWLSGLALIVMATSAFKQFFNLNPLIKLDGYYLLSDLLDVPNLRQRAFDYLRSFVRKLTGAPMKPVSPASRRERWIFAAYGAVAFTFSYWFLGTIVLGIGGYLTERYQGAGFGAFVAFSALLFPKSMRRLFNHRVKLLILAAGLVTLAFILRVPLRVGGALELRPARNADVAAAVAGVIERVYVDEGDVVRTGDTLAVLSPHEQRARLSAVQAEIAEKEAQLRLLNAGPRAEEVAVARLEAARLLEPLKLAETQAARMRQLATTNAVTPAEYERAREQVAVLSNELQQARARLDLLLAGSRPEEILAMAQAVERARAERDRLQGEMGRLSLLAPHGGVVTTPRLHEKVGAYVKPGDLVAEVHALDRLTAEIAVSERDIGEVRIGSPVAIRLRSHPGRTFQGKVTRVAQTVVDSVWRVGTAPRSVRVEVDLENGELLLKPKMTGYARITTGDRRLIDVLTLRLRRFIRVEFWSWW